MTTAIKKYKEIPKLQELISDDKFHFITHLAPHTSQDPFVHAITNWIILGSYTRFQNLHDVLITLSCWIGSLTHNGVTVSPPLLSLLTASALLPQQAPTCQTSPTLCTMRLSS